MPATPPPPPPIVALDQGAARPAAVVRDGHVRITVLTPSLLRLEYAADDAFEDRPTITFPDRRQAVPRFTVSRRHGTLTVRTAAVTFRYRRGSGPFSAGNTTAVLHVGGVTATITPDPARNPAPLGGWRRSLDLVDGPVDLHPGLLSRAGWHVVDDSATALAVPGSPGFAVRPAHSGAAQDRYLFAYGHDPARALRDLRAVTGAAPLLPRKAFGVWFSRYWPYGDGDLRALVARFRSERVPLDTLSLDTDYKRVNDASGAAIGAAVAGAPGTPFSWNGWEWNRDLFPDAAGFVRWAHEQGIALALNVHPSIDDRDPRFAETQAAAGGGLTPDDGCRINQADPQGTCMVFDWTKGSQLDAYFALHAPFERDGIDLWWLDWCCDGSKADAPGLTPDTFINWRYAERQRARGSRWPAFQRIGASYQLGFGGDGGGDGVLAEHRQAIQFTGDTCGSWPLLRFAAAFTAAENAIGMPYVSHDIGSFHSVSPLGVCDKTVSPLLTPELNSLPGDMYARWVQLGTFQPLLRLHSHHGKRLPWDYPGKPGAVAADFLRLREALVPYLYTAAREAHDTGLPMVRALWLAWPRQDAAYASANAAEFALGRDLVVAPITGPGDPAKATLWVPPGTWVDFFTGERLRGPRSVDVDVPLQRMPVLVRAGALLATQPEAPTTAAGPARSLVLTAYPGAWKGRATVYDDAGDGLDYLHGGGARIPVSQQRRGRRVVVTIGPIRGRFAGMPRTRSWEVRVLGAPGVAPVVRRVRASVHRVVRVTVTLRQP